MLKRLIIFLVRKKLGVKKWQEFQFANQKSTVDRYFFTDNDLSKYVGEEGIVRPAKVNLNWLLDDDCELKICENNILEKGRVI